jgi:DUF2997 family protein
MNVIEIVVAINGETKVKTLGFFGPSCRDASRFIEQAIGRKVDETLTTEYHLCVVIDQITQQQN